MNTYESMMLGIAVGDAFGSAYEFAKGGKERVRESLVVDRYVAHLDAGWRTTGAGRYTDDTQMSIGVAELLISEKEFTKKSLADSFVNAFKRDPIDGYARKFQGFLKRVRDGEEFLGQVKPDSVRNGAAMRSVPLGVLHSPDLVVSYARINASLTHDTPEGHVSSAAVGLASHYLLRRAKNPKGLLAFIHPYLCGIDERIADYIRDFSSKDDPANEQGIPCHGVHTVTAAFNVLSSSSSPLEVLRSSVLLGGDTDSTASIALGLYAINDDLSSLPRGLHEGLDDGPYGKQYIIGLGRKLGEKFG